MAADTISASSFKACGGLGRRTRPSGNGLQQVESDVGQSSEAGALRLSGNAIGFWTSQSFAGKPTRGILKHTNKAVFFF